MLMLFGTTYSCKCKNRTIEEYYSNSDVVVLVDIINEGKIIVENGSFPKKNNVTYKVIESYKKSVFSTSIYTTTTSNCSTGLNQNNPHLLFLDPYHYTNRCSGSRQIDTTSNNWKELRSKLVTLKSIDIGNTK